MVTTAIYLDPAAWQLAGFSIVTFITQVEQSGSMHAKNLHTTILPAYM